MLRFRKERHWPIAPLVTEQLTLLRNHELASKTISGRYMEFIIMNIPSLIADRDYRNGIDIVNGTGSWKSTKPDGHVSTVTTKGSTARAVASRREIRRHCTEFSRSDLFVFAFSGTCRKEYVAIVTARPDGVS